MAPADGGDRELDLLLAKLKKIQVMFTVIVRLGRVTVEKKRRISEKF